MFLRFPLTPHYLRPTSYDKKFTLCSMYDGPQNLDSVISYTWEIKGGGPSGRNAKEVSAFI